MYLAYFGAACRQRHKAALPKSATYPARRGAICGAFRDRNLQSKVKPNSIYIVLFRPRLCGENIFKHNRLYHTISHLNSVSAKKAISLKIGNTKNDFCIVIFPKIIKKDSKTGDFPPKNRVHEKCFFDFLRQKSHVSCFIQLYSRDFAISTTIYHRNTLRVL